MSLVSTASSSLYSTPEDKQAQEMRRLRRDLSEAQQKVHSLSSQISTNVSTLKGFVTRFNFHLLYLPSYKYFMFTFGRLSTRIYSIVLTRLIIYRTN